MVTMKPGRVDRSSSQLVSLGGTPLRQKFGNYDGRRRLRSLVKGQLCLQSPTEYDTRQKEKLTLEYECSRNLMFQPLPVPMGSSLQHRNPWVLNESKQKVIAQA